MLVCENSANICSPTGDDHKFSVTNYRADILDIPRRDFLLAWAEACQSGLIRRDEIAQHVVAMLCDMERAATEAGVVA